MIKTIITPNRAEHDRMVTEDIEAGYEITGGYGNLFGFNYHSIMFKPDVVPLTRAEVLEKARAAKKLKSLGGVADEQEDEEEQLPEA